MIFQNQFSGALSSGLYALDRIRTRNDMCKERLLDTKKTHFTVGYAQPDFNSLHAMSFTGKRKNDADLKPAGDLFPNLIFGPCKYLIELNRT